MADDSLTDVPLFEGIPAPLLAPLREGTVVRSYAQGETVFSHGDVPRYLYVVQSGQVDILLPAMAEHITLATFDPGSFFGELAVFDHQPRSATAQAAVDTILICVPLDRVAELLDSHPAAARHFMRVIIGRLRSADELLARIRTRNVNEMADEKMSFGERVADLVARFGGSWTFIICFGVFLLAWMGVNTAWLMAAPPDPFPYIFLNLILSCLAALQAPVIMMSQNRQAAKDRLQADEDYRVNVKAEFAIQQLHRKLDELRASLVRSR
jgi:CRP/FNR family transcriptional regulator, cyclic AMP receptor protein